ncbi:hypothetical protein PVK06_041630 [Gossypium arboreum]|uniref:Uncharacterized protein n=1 Tax=Gossypium arboreum TaxID=29729 RepID=A0ABR0N8Q6_GOSAR|nr:hypothetical protein PVK06_041630 [Gossypium arboreum]
MNFKSLSLFSISFIALCFTVASAASFNIRNNCPYKEPVSGVEPIANSTEPDEADAKPVTVGAYFSAKPMVHPQTPWLNSH